MFTIRASYSDKIEIRTNLDRVREFFCDNTNFIQFMPNIESIHKDGKGITHWNIRVEIPIFGTFSQKFSVDISEDSEERTEWLPIFGETKNFLKYAVDYLDIGSNATIIQFSQMVEMRRKSATEFHLLAGLAGEHVISTEMTKRIADMLTQFVKMAKIRLEET